MYVLIDLIRVDYVVRAIYEKRMLGLLFDFPLVLSCDYWSRLSLLKLYLKLCTCRSPKLSPNRIVTSLLHILSKDQSKHTFEKNALKYFVYRLKSISAGLLCVVIFFFRMLAVNFVSAFFFLLLLNFFFLYTFWVSVFCCCCCFCFSLFVCSFVCFLLLDSWRSRFFSYNFTRLCDSCFRVTIRQLRALLRQATKTFSLGTTQRATMTDSWR